MSKVSKSKFLGSNVKNATLSVRIGAVLAAISLGFLWYWPDYKPNFFMLLGTLGVLLVTLGFTVVQILYRPQDTLYSQKDTIKK